MFTSASEIIRLLVRLTAYAGASAVKKLDATDSLVGLKADATTGSIVVSASGGPCQRLALSCRTIRKMECLCQRGDVPVGCPRVEERTGEPLDDRSGHAEIEAGLQCVAGLVAVVQSQPDQEKR